MMFCTHCGRENPAGANFCGNCGQPLKPVGEATTGSLRSDEVMDAGEVDVHAEAGAVVPRLEPGTALLLALRGANRGARYLLDRDVVSVGRHPDSDIFLDDITVSRRHAEVRRDGEQFWIHDTGSLNGTYVNGSRVEDALLAMGDELQIGKFKLVAFLATAST